jgi:hypothetical protein
MFFSIDARVAKVFPAGPQHKLGDLHRLPIGKQFAGPAVDNCASTLQSAFDHIFAEAGQDERGVSAA